jgi:hypothetical protein
VSEESAIWMFLSIAAICYTWHKIAATPKRAEPAPQREISLIFNGKPFTGSMEVTADGKTHTYKIVDGKIA